jgi:hypothetical protein
VASLRDKFVLETNKPGMETVEAMRSTSSVCGRRGTKWRHDNLKDRFLRSRLGIGGACSEQEWAPVANGPEGPEVPRSARPFCRPTLVEGQDGRFAQRLLRSCRNPERQAKPPVPPRRNSRKE